VRLAAGPGAFDATAAKSVTDFPAPLKRRQASCDQCAIGARELAVAKSEMLYQLCFSLFHLMSSVTNYGRQEIPFCIVPRNTSFENFGTFDFQAMPTPKQLKTLRTVVPPGGLVAVNKEFFAWLAEASNWPSELLML
jgi:hypothetical protein